MANVSRTQYDEEKAVSRKIYQQGKFIADADLTEQATINMQRERRSLSCLIGHNDARFDEGFSVVESTQSRTVTIKAGSAAFHLDDEHSVMITNFSDISLGGFSTWAIERTDLVYIDIEEKEYTPSDDLSLINPLIGEETTRDMRIDWNIAIAENTTELPTPPTGHVYREICSITKTTETPNIISTADIDITLPHIRGSLINMEIPIWTLHTENRSGSDAESLTTTNQQYYAEASSGGNQVLVVKIPYIFDPSHKYLALYCECWRDTGAIGVIEVEGMVYGGFASWIWNHEPSLQVTYLDPWASGGEAGQMYEIYIAIKAHYAPGSSGTQKCYIQKPVLVAGLGSYDISRSKRVIG